MQLNQIHSYDAISMVGVTIVLITYFLLQCGKLDAKSYSYSIYNIIGSLLILYSLLFAWNLAAVIIEVAWVAISVVGIYRQYVERRQVSKTTK